MPAWEVDNEYILTGYRLRYHTFKEVALTLFRCHNETFNVCSHLLDSLAAISVIIIILCYYPNMGRDASYGVMEGFQA